MTQNEYQIILFYKYVNIPFPEAVMAWQRDMCRELELKGRVIVAHEGINATLEGTHEHVKEYCRTMEQSETFRGIHYKMSNGTGSAFPRLSVKVRPEIVSMHLGNEDFDPKKVTGKRLSPEKLHEWYEQGKEFTVVDMRNDYECKVGMFDGSVNPKLRNFRDLSGKLPELEYLKDKTVLTVCTGGVRCEKASGYLKTKGFSDVYQLDGGIVSYMEKYPNKNFLGKLYVFDGRITMGFETDNKEHKVIGTCDKCGAPSDAYGDCAYVRCPRHLICCENCREDGGEVYCSPECRDLV